MTVTLFEGMAEGGKTMQVLLDPICGTLKALGEVRYAREIPSLHLISARICFRRRAGMRLISW